MISWIKEGWAAFLELVELHYRHIHLRQSYADASRTIALRKYTKQGG
jgi:hypothetical protein